MGVLTAAAVVELSPRAAAGYLTVATPQTSTSLGAESGDTDPSAPSPIANRLYWQQSLPYFTPSQSNGMTSTGTGGSSTDGPPSGMTLLTDLPVGGMAVYYREPSSRLELSRFIDTVLDPPRGL
jgi:hypothetical protein